MSLQKLPGMAKQVMLRFWATQKLVLTYLLRGFHACQSKWINIKGSASLDTTQPMILLDLQESLQKMQNFVKDKNITRNNMRTF